MGYKGLVFDLDATLVYTRPEYRYGVVTKTLRELGVGDVKEAHIDAFWFRGGRDNIIRQHFGVEPHRFWSVFRKYDLVELRRDLTVPYDDADILPELVARGLKMGVVTNSPAHIANMEINMLGRENFNSIVIANRALGPKPKPHPQGLKLCLINLGLTKMCAPYIGNSDEDVMAARNAGMPEIFLDRGEHDFSHINPPPNMTIHSLYGLRDILD